LKAVAVPNNSGRFVHPIRILAHLFGLFKIDECRNREEQQNEEKTIKDKVRNFHRLALSTSPATRPGAVSGFGLSGTV